MGWFSKFFKAVPREEMAGICLDRSRPYWEIPGPETFVEIFRALQRWPYRDSILYFEGGSPDQEITNFMKAHAIPEQAHVTMGTIWPRPKIFHVPANESTLTMLATIMERHAEPELAVHFHIYQGARVLLEWYDAFSLPILLSGDIPEEEIKSFAEIVGKKYQKKLAS